MEAVRAGTHLRSANLRSANLRGAYLGSADLRSANLRSANLRSANLRSANLGSADLSSADLSGAYLGSADLSGAYLRSAKGINKFLTSPLHMLRDQPGKIRAYKLVTPDGYGPFNGGLKYEVGQAVEVADPNVHEEVECGSGINVASMDWILKNYEPGRRVLVVEFEAADIAAIPLASDGKFRLHRCRVVGEKTLAELGFETKDKKAVKAKKVEA